VFNDTRFIEDMTGMIEPIDEFCKQGFRIIKGMTSSLYGVVLYKKLSTIKLNHVLNNARTKLTNPTLREEKFKEIQDAHQNAFSKKADQLRQNYFGDEYGRRNARKANGTSKDETNSVSGAKRRNPRDQR
jgi:hypothetical protein